MIQVCRAEDGQVVQVEESLWELERVENLEAFLEEKTGVAHDSILAYLSDGRRLTTDNVRDLAGVQDQTIYVFNKRYLDLDPVQVMLDLHLEPALEPSVEETIQSTPPLRPSTLAPTYVHVAHTHAARTEQLLQSLRVQHTALRIASSALDLHVLSLADVFEGLSEAAGRELARQEGLLSGLSADLELAARVPVHREFVSPAVRRAMDAGDRGRTLGDYVSRGKMTQVADNCRRTHDELREKLGDAQKAMTRLTQGADEVRAVVADASSLDEAEACVRHAQEEFERMADLGSALERPTSSSDKALQDLRHLDASLRRELHIITQIKNSYTEQCILALRQISMLNNDLVELPPALSALQTSMKSKTGFSHIQRLHNMLYAYGATVVEVVRRKEFARFFYQRAQSVLEVMAKLSANERKRRQVYRGEVHGQLPFETKGMDDPVPSIDFSPTGPPESPYSLERADIDGLLQVLDDLERFAKSSEDTATLSSVQEARAGLEKLIGKMDSLEAGFDRIAERSLLSASRLSTHRRRSTGDDQAYLELELQVQELQKATADQETAYLADRAALEAEIAHLRDSLGTSEQARAELERDLHSVRAQLEGESTSRRLLEGRNAELWSDTDAQREALAQALAEATEQTRSAEILRQELAQVRAEFEDVKALEQRNADKVAALLEEQASALARLEEARSRGEDLEAQIRGARTESDEVKRALAEAGREKDRLLRAQASEHDRLLRDHIAEADGDRAVLEHKFSELRAELEDRERQLKDSRTQAEVALADSVRLREELQRVEHELREARHAERVLREDLRAGRASQSDYELRLENSSRLVAQLLDVALAFRDSHVKALLAAQAMSSHPGGKAPNSTNSLGLSDASFSPGRHGVINHMGEPSPIDPSDPAAALEVLRAFDHDHFLEIINKTGSTIRKWQKQCKEYRERAKGKISFRNFAKGDLALFLPTRNSVSKPWAAFNVSFPHYFLKATGHLAEQLKSREWIVARITSITERVVDHKDPSTNPYGLGDGVKYYMLEVEDWTQPAYPSKRRESARKVAPETPESPGPTAEDPPSLPPGPPEPEVEDSFNATRPPTSRLFPQRSRANTSPAAGPSSLSRLLAQAGLSEAQPASAETQSEAQVQAPITQKPPSPAVSTLQVPPSPTQTSSVARGSHAPGMPSPRRPGSRASRGSTSSRFSVSRIPFGGSASAAKAAPTTAISEHAISTLESGSDVNVSATGSSSSTSVPSPDGSPTEGMFHQLATRRRTSSYHVTPTNALSAGLSSSPSVPSPLSAGNTRPFADTAASAASASSRLASLASSWGMSFGRKRRSEIIDPASVHAANSSDAGRAATPTNAPADIGSSQSLSNATSG
ncbi:hypothetical protein CERSUDRAFT_116294 [Gelatoporia subvermispora B]|uniref:Autophagy-related protein 11 n=1 Tax=Ceriporiopsis subvermispora (strain B) TaxID=914234 RepID=M2QTZ7_CERS8|nr:hypothetical protein CERSUDRAFT_116294 [Gelatoporia subvermispora B]